MSILQFGLSSIYMDPLFRDSPLDSPWYERLIAVGIVVLLHLILLAGWLLLPETPRVAINELSISFANMRLPQADVVPPVNKPELRPELKPEPEQEPESREITPESVFTPEPIVRESTPDTPESSPPAPIQLDTEPDYRADYLNNPRPPYPMVARRMGYQGKVILDVEVLAEGRAGEVKLYQGSGYEILDRAAMETVRTWRFSPARRLGQPVTKWFKVPIKFSLESDDS